MKKVLIGGVFDLLHYGHVAVLKKAKEYGDYLIVNVLSDERVRYKKGNCRPILSENERMKIIQELKVVDEVVCIQGNINEASHFQAMKEVKPDVLLIDCSEHQDLSLEEKACKELNIELIRTDRIITDSELCTSKIIEKIKKME